MSPSHVDSQFIHAAAVWGVAYRYGSEVHLQFCACMCMRSVSYRGWGAQGFPTPSSASPPPSFADSTVYFVLLSHPKWNQVLHLLVLNEKCVYKRGVARPENGRREINCNVDEMSVSALAMVYNTRAP